MRTATAGNEKVRATTEEAKGQAGETVACAVGDERVTAEGRAAQSKGDARQAEEKTKDVFRQ
ncbi:CsbD family protein [Streptomyces sp. NPDC006465]|uniref:CsbD family protein n=1 Tax=Streptomyces sp. NPDC006465 TaxID=3157174 RepID=UPI0033A070C4